MTSKKIAFYFGARIVLLAFALAATCNAQQSIAQRAAQNASRPEADARYDRLEAKMQEVIESLQETRVQLNDSHKQIEGLRQELGALRTQLSGEEQADTGPASQSVSDLRTAVSQLEDNDAILQAEVKQHEQTKIESISKYPVKISGLMLFNAALNTGPVDDADLPTFAVPPSVYAAQGSLSATARQTVLGIDVAGPHIWGAQSSADARVDFFGGFPTVGYDSTAGLVRMRTARLKLDWPATSVIAGVDTPLISPRHPSSYLTVAQPALAWSGDLWTWAPQIEFIHRFRGSTPDASSVELGLIDPAAPRPLATQNPRQPSPGESSRQPGYEARVQYAIGSGDRPAILGAGGYYGRQRYPGDQRVDSWAGTADGRLPIGERVELSGELYRGRAIGGLGGGVFKDNYVDGNSGRLSGLDAIGGWTQFKARLTSSLEANGAIGEDNGFAGELRSALPPASTTVYSVLARNRTVLGNLIFRPKAYIVLSLEYRNIFSWQVSGRANHVDSVGLAAGYLF